MLVALTGVLIALAAPALAQAAPGIASFESLVCKENAPIGVKKECTASTESEFFTQAGGFPNFGITDFTLNVGEFEYPGNGVKSIRTDIPIGFSTNPEALARCSQADFNANLDTFEENHCPESSIAGVQEAIIIKGENKITHEPEFEKIEGTAYNLVPKNGLGLEFGIDIPLEFLEPPLTGLHVHSNLEGFVSWHHEKEAEEEGIASGDYHEFFKIKVGKSISEGEAPIVTSRLIFNGANGMLRNPTGCPGPQKNHLRIETYTGKVATAEYTTTASAEQENCGALSFEPSFEATTANKLPDEGTGLSTSLKFADKEKESDMKTAVVTLPEGFTINPSAAHGLQACTSEQLHSESLEPECPERSDIGTAVISVPGLPSETLTGKIYLGASSVPITGPPYKIYVAVDSKRYGQVIRLEGTAEPNLETGQLTTTFANVPEGPSLDTKLTFNGGVFADLATPQSCGLSKVNASFFPYARPGESKTITPELEVAGGRCPSGAGFALFQNTSSEPATAGSSSAFTFNLERPAGQQYLKTVSTTLPSGLIGFIPQATQCAEPAASQGTCPASSQIGTATVLAGAGTEPFQFNGKVYLTGPYNGSPFGLSIVTPVVAGPFNFGNEITRAKIDVNQTTAQVTVSATLPTIKQGVPIRLRSLSVTVNRQGFEHNPTNCGAQTVSSVLGSTEGAKQTLTSPFQAEGCSGLSFKPSFAASSSAKTSKVNGASLTTTLKMPNEGANVKSVLVTLPKQLPSRLTTLQKACTEATFAANPFSCPEASDVGTVTAVSPTLPGVLKGPAYLVSHGGAAFPDLDLIVEGSGVRVILVGNTDIKNGITTTNFAATPDVPVSEVTVNLPTGPHSALAAYGDTCRNPLYMPTTITGQNGSVFKQNTKITVTECGVKIIGQKVIGNTLYLTVKTFAPGKITAKGASLRTTSKSLGSAQNAVSLKVPLSNAGRGRHKPFKVKVTVSFTPKTKSVGRSSSSATVKFRR